MELINILTQFQNHAMQTNLEAISWMQIGFPIGCLSRIKKTNNFCFACAGLAAVFMDLLQYSHNAQNILSDDLGTFTGYALGLKLGSELINYLFSSKLKQDTSYEKRGL